MTAATVMTLTAATMEATTSAPPMAALLPLSTEATPATIARDTPAAPEVTRPIQTRGGCWPAKK
jgi:hypothetical protein